MELVYNDILNTGTCRYSDKLGKIVVIIKNDGTCIIKPKFHDEGLKYDLIKISYPPAVEDKGGITLSYTKNDNILKEEFDLFNSMILDVVQKWIIFRKCALILNYPDNAGEEAVNEAKKYLSDSEEYSFYGMMD